MKGDYEILSSLGRGGQATTWLARHIPTGREVALKELRMGEVADWKSVELFEREAEVLRGLDFPDIPEYIDAFTEESEKKLSLWLVQEYVAGQNLREELSTKGRWPPSKAAKDLERVLEILVHLHDRVPPVVHRDIKPSNLLRRSDGRLCLVDFGAVQFDSGTSAGSTVIGTPGYMPMEQMTGQAEPRSDLYSLGVTFGHLMTGLAPSQVRLVRTRLDFRAHLDRDSRALSVIETLTAPALEDRFISARRALEALREPSAKVVSPPHPVAVPPGEPSPEQPPSTLRKRLYDGISRTLSTALDLTRKGVGRVRSNEGARKRRRTPDSVLESLVKPPPEGKWESLHRRSSSTERRVESPEDISGSPLLQAAEHLGFERLGKRSRFSYPFVATADVWSDPTGRVYLVHCPDDPVANHSRWFLVTLLEDGGFALQSETSVAGLDGGNWRLKASGDLLKDYERQLQHVETLEKEGRVPVEGVSDVDVFLSVYEASVGELVTLKDRATFWALMFLCGWLILWFPVVIRAWTYLKAKRALSQERRTLPPLDAPTLPPLLDVGEVSAEASVHEIAHKN